MNPDSGAAPPNDETAAAFQTSGSGVEGVDQREPWGGLLASAGPRDHIVQLYQDQQFLNRAVCRFAASAIANGEGVIKIPSGCVETIGASCKQMRIFEYEAHEVLRSSAINPAEKRRIVGELLRKFGFAH